MSVRAFFLTSLLILAPIEADGGRVVDRDAKPVSGAEVTVLVTGSWESVALPAPEIRGTTDDEGNIPFTLPAIAAAMIVIDHPAFAPAVRTGNERFAGDIRLDAGRVWHARVLAPSAPGESLDGEICAAGEIAVTSLATKHRWRRCADVEAGSFVIEGLPEGPITVDLQIAGFLPRAETVDPLKITTLHVERGLRLRGLVTDAREQPLGGAVVVAGRARARSDAKGRFSIAVDALPVRLEVSMLGFRPWKDDIARATGLEVRLAPAARVSGVLTTEDGGPIHGATVEIVRLRPDGGHSTFSNNLDIDDEGMFVVDVPEPGRNAIAFRATGYREARFPDLQIGDGAMLPLGFVALRRGAGVRGIIVDASTGKGAAGALIDIVPAGALLLQTLQQYSVPAFVADENGLFTAGGYESGRYLLRIRHGRSAPFHQLVDFGGDEIVTVGTVTLDRGVELRGRLSAFDREVMRAVPVRLFDPAREMLEPLAATRTDQDGLFRFPAVSPARYRVEVGGEQLLLAQEIIVRGNAPVMEVALHAAGVQVGGRVTRNGVPVSGGVIRLISELDPARRRGKIIMRRGGGSLGWGMPQSSFSANVNADGSFNLIGAPVGLIRLWYIAPAGNDVFRSLVLSGQPEHRVDIELQGHTLEGLLVDAATGGAVAGSMRLFDVDGRPLSETAAAADGTFRLLDLERGSYLLEARATGYLPSAPKVVSAGEGRSPHVFELQSGNTGKLEVALKRADGSGASGVPIIVFDARGELSKALPTDESGRRLFHDVPAGTYIAGWSDPLAGAGSASPVRVDALHTPRVASTLARGASVVIACPHHECSAAPIGLFEIHSRDGLELTPLLNGITPALRLSEDGDLSIGRLAPGRYRFRLWVAERRWEKEVTVVSEDLRVVFQ